MLRQFNNRRRKLSFIGASYKFVHQGVRDMIISPKLSGTDMFQNTDVYLYDIDPVPMNLEYDVISRMIRENKSGIRVFKCKSRQEALDGADYVVVSVLVGGMDVAEAEDKICQEYGIRHTVGDTVGPMSTARCLRMAPLLLDIAADMEKACPGTPMLSVTNPMAVLTHAVNTYSKVECVGICHGTEGQVRQLAKLYDVGRNEVCVDVCGVNHLGFIRRVEINGRNVPIDEVIEKSREALKKGYKDTATGKMDESDWAYEFFRITKLMPNNGDHHFTEFFPWFFAKHAFDAQGHNKYNLNKRLHDAQARRENQKWYFDVVSGWAYAPEDKLIPDMHAYSSENIVDMISGYENRGRVNSSELHLNMTNNGAIPNLPRNCNLELTCHFTPRGMQPVAQPALDPYPLGVLMPLISLNDLAMKAAVERNKQSFIEALLLDPLLQDFDTVEALAEKLWKVNDPWIKPKK